METGNDQPYTAALSVKVLSSLESCSICNLLLFTEMWGGAIFDKSKIEFFQQLPPLKTFLPV